MAAFIANHGVTPCLPGFAIGTGLFKATAGGRGKDDVDYLGWTKNKRSGVESLAKAKILTMFHDLAGRIYGEGFTAKLGPVNFERIRHTAYRWFFVPNEDFPAWCDTAGLDTDYVREKARAVWEKGIPEWRAAPGKGKNFETRKTYREAIRKQRGIRERQ